MRRLAALTWPTAGAVFGVMAATAAAATAIGRDRDHGARFALNGRTLTVTLAMTSDVRGFAGERVRAECVSQRRQGAGVSRMVNWPRSRTLRVRFRAGAGSAPVFCSVDTASLRDLSYHVDAVLK